MKKLDIQKNGRPCIYSIKNNINGKLYIGSAIGHYRRKAQHFYLLRRGLHWNKHLQSSYNKYGESVFEFIVIEFIESIEDLQKKEEYYIKEMNTTNIKFGYNIRIDCSTNLGKKWPIEARIKFSLSKKGKKIKYLNYIEIANKNKKKVIATNKLNGNSIEFNSIKEAGKNLNIQRTSISKALKKVIKSAGNYYWDYAIAA